MKYAPNPKNYHYLFATFDSQCFCSLTCLSINALLTYIVFYLFFLFCCQTRKLFFATVYSKKMTSFLKQRKENQNENTLLKWRALLSHSSFAVLFLFISDIDFIICNYKIFFYLDALNGICLMKHKYLYVKLLIYTYGSSFN